MAALYVVLQRSCVPARTKPPTYEPLDPEETVKGVALAALKEIEFDRETGKLSDADYEFLKAKYTGQAVEALRAERRQSEMSDVEALIAARVRTLRSAVVPAPLTHSSECTPAVPLLWPSTSGARCLVLFDLRRPAAACRCVRGMRRGVGAR